MDNRLSKTLPSASKYDPQIASILLTQTDLSDNKIAQTLGVNQSTITRFKAKLGEQIKEVKEQIDHVLPLILNSLFKNAALQDRVLEHYINMPDEEFNGISDKTKTSIIGYTNAGIGTTIDKYRLETNQSTSNVGLSGQIEHLLSNPDTLTKLASTIRDRRRASIVGDNASDGRDSGNDLPGSSHTGCDNPSISPCNEDVIDIVDDNSNV